MDVNNLSGKLDALSLIKINQEKYEKEKKERQERFTLLQQERQRILSEREKILNRLHEDKTIQFPLSRQSNMSTNTAVHLARNKIPLIEKRIQDNVNTKEIKRNTLANPYRGELGIRSYEAWQLKDFYFIREFVQSWINEVVDYIVIEDRSHFEDNFDVYSTTNELQKQLTQEQHEMELSKCVKDVQSDLVTEVCSEILSDNINEVISINNYSEIVITSMILNAVIPQNMDESAVTLVSKTFNQMKKERNRHPKIWQHSQKFENLGSEDIETTEKEQETFDGRILSFQGINLISDTPHQELPINFKKYRAQESKFWSQNHPTCSSLPIPRRYKGITCGSLSPDHSLLALGTLQGDIAIWNINEYPPRILKGSRGNSSILHINWSLNSIQIVTINQRGSMQIWSLGKPSGTIDIKAFEPISNDGFQTTQLINELTLDPKDLVFTKGNLSSAKTGVSKPTFALFHPSFTLLGWQESLVVGLSSGNILKLHLGLGATFLTGQRIDSSNNQIGRGIEAELFKAHKHPVILITFIKDENKMLSVDNEGFINLWYYNEDSLSGYGWFTPSSSYKLDMTQRTYKPSEGSKGKVEFTDVVKGTGRVKELNRREMVEKRKEMQSLINSLHLGKPWQTNDVGNQKVKFLYAPKNVPESGATFHSVTYYRENKLLAEYTTQLYQPITIHAAKLVSCKTSPQGDQILMSLLFNEVSPKAPHVLFVTIEIKSMRIAKNLIEVPLSQQEYNQCLANYCCDFDISRYIDATGAQYVFTNVCGTIGGFSLTSTNMILASALQGWEGCTLSQDQSTIFSTARVLVASQNLGICVIFFAPKVNTVNLLHIRDDSLSVDREKVWQAYKVLTNTSNGFHPRLTLHKQQWTVDGQTDFHLECAMEAIILDLVDMAICQSNGTSYAKSEGVENSVWPYIRRSQKYSNQS